MNLISSFKLARIQRRAERLRRQRVATPALEPWMMPDRHCVIASYPRSGNTWLSNMVVDVLLQQQGIETATQLPVNEREVIPDLDRGDLETCRFSHYAPRPTAKTHLNYLSWMQKGVFLLRQPADTLASYFHFHSRYPERREETNGGIDRFCIRFVEQWCLHASSFLWACQHQADSFKVITYELLLDEPHAALRGVLDHLEIKASVEQVETAVSNHQFCHHAKREGDIDQNSKFYRNGKKDSGRKELLSQTLDRINSIGGPLYEQALKWSVPLNRTYAFE